MKAYTAETIRLIDPEDEPAGYWLFELFADDRTFFRILRALAICAAVLLALFAIRLGNGALVLAVGVVLLAADYVRRAA
jgi:hypothetical protein